MCSSQNIQCIFHKILKMRELDPERRGRRCVGLRAQVQTWCIDRCEQARSLLAFNAKLAQEQFILASRDLDVEV